MRQNIPFSLALLVPLAVETPPLMRRALASADPRSNISFKDKQNHVSHCDNVSAISVFITFEGIISLSIKGSNVVRNDALN